MDIIRRYENRELNFKEAAHLCKLGLTEFVLLLSKHDIEPPHLEEAELISSKIAETITREELFKNPNYKRKTKEKEF